MDPSQTDLYPVTESHCLYKNTSFTFTSYISWVEGKKKKTEKYNKLFFSKPIELAEQLC